MELPEDRRGGGIVPGAPGGPPGRRPARRSLQRPVRTNRRWLRDRAEPGASGPARIGPRPGGRPWSAALVGGPNDDNDCWSDHLTRTRPRVAPAESWTPAESGRTRQCRRCAGRRRRSCQKCAAATLPHELASMSGSRGARTQRSVHGSGLRAGRGARAGCANDHNDCPGDHLTLARPGPACAVARGPSRVCRAHVTVARRANAQRAGASHWPLEPGGYRQGHRQGRRRARAVGPLPPPGPRGGALTQWGVDRAKGARLPFVDAHE